MPRRWSLVVAALVIAALLAPGPPGAAPKKLKKLIEFGWDEPDPSFMRRHLRQLEASPFDGCVYHLLYTRPGHPPGRFTWEAWGTRAFTAAELDTGVRDLVATRFRRFTSNFLRLNVTPGTIDWFDDYGAVLSNMRLAASIAKRGRSAGILLDTEPYEGRLFEYPAQRDTARHSFAEYSAQARRRGAEVIRAFEAGYPGLTVFLTYGASQPYIEWIGTHIRPEVGHYGLLTAFVEGMVSAASDSARIVDGAEGSYPAKDPALIDEYLRLETHGVATWVSDSTRYRRVVSRSFGIWLDNNWRRHGWNARSPERNYRSPAKLKLVVRRALQLADDYVWVYSETPRWWTETGKPRDLPAAYDRALRDARRGLTR